MKEGFEQAMEDFLREHEVTINGTITLSNGTKVWEVNILENTEVEIKKLDYVTHYEDTKFYYPS